MSDLLARHESGSISDSELMKKLWVDDPLLMMTLYRDIGTFNECFKIDLVTAQTNGAKGMRDDKWVFFDESVFINERGEVAAEYVVQHSTAVHANIILNHCLLRNMVMCFSCPLNHQCCRELVGGGTTCDSALNRRCCNTGPGVPNCTQSQGNFCSE